MIAAIIIGVWFYRLADTNKLNKVLWPIVGIVSFILGQFIAGMVIGLTSPSSINDQGTLIIGGLIGGALGTLVAYLIIQSQIKSQKAKTNDSIIDEGL